MKRTLLLASAALLIAAVGVGLYSYATDRGRRTTDPEFDNLAGEFIEGKLRYPSNPHVEISFTPEYKYLGGQKFILYGTADVEQHFYAKPHTDGGAESVVFIQFESVRPGVNWQYDYSSSPLREQIGDFDFFTNTWAGARHPIFWYGRPGSDGYMSRKFVANKGYPVPKDYAYARLVHLPTEDRREEIIFVFMEDLAPTGFSGRDLQVDGDHRDKWADISARHLEKIRSVMTIEPTN